MIGEDCPCLICCAPKTSITDVGLNRNSALDSKVDDNHAYHPELEIVDPRPTYQFLVTSIQGNLMTVLTDR
jgi:hypothetical protein